MLDRRRLLAAATATAASPWMAAAQAQPKDGAHHAMVRLLNGFPPGGSVDAVSRRLTEAMQGSYGKVQVVDNRSGAGGRLAIDLLKQAPADGSVYLLTPADMFTIYPHIYPKLNYALKDFVPVSTVCSFDYLWAVGPGVPASVRTLADYVTWVRKTPDQQSYASPAAGTPSHFVGSMFSGALGLGLTHVAYRGSPSAIQDLLGGQVPAFCTTVPDLLAYRDDPRIRVLAVATRERSAFLPHVPTFTEQGYAQLVLSPNFMVVMLPRAVSLQVVATLAGAVREAVAQPRFQDAMRMLGQLPDWSGPEAAVQRLAADTAHWGGVVKKTGFVAE